MIRLAMVMKYTPGKEVVMCRVRDVCIDRSIRAGGVYHGLLVIVIPIECK